jgi:hypothetical protein
MPPLVRDYFEADLAHSRHPTAYMTFHPSTGWSRLPYNKRLSLHWLNQMQLASITRVQVRYQGRQTDFSVEEMLRSYP